MISVRLEYQTDESVVTHYQDDGIFWVGGAVSDALQSNRDRSRRLTKIVIDPNDDGSELERITASTQESQ